MKRPRQYRAPVVFAVFDGSLKVIWEEDDRVWIQDNDDEFLAKFDLNKWRFPSIIDFDFIVNRLFAHEEFLGEL